MLFTQPVLWYAIHIVGRAGPTVEQLMLGVCGVSPALRDATRFSRWKKRWFTGSTSLSRDTY